MHHELSFFEDTPYSPRFNDVYHSNSGAWEQSRHVFIKGCQLPDQWNTRHTKTSLTFSNFRVIEMGFGLGVNFMQTAYSWLHDRNATSCYSHLLFESIEKYPVSPQEMQNALEKMGFLSPLHPAFSFSCSLIHQWQIWHPSFSTSALFEKTFLYPNGTVTLRLTIGDAFLCVNRISPFVEAIYLDGFAPSKNTDMWSLALFQKLAQLSHTQTRIATYSCASQVKKNLEKAGFFVEKIKGYAQKRHMLAGFYQGR